MRFYKILVDEITNMPTPEHIYFKMFLNPTWKVPNKKQAALLQTTIIAANIYTDVFYKKRGEALSTAITTRCDSDNYYSYFIPMIEVPKYTRGETILSFNYVYNRDDLIFAITDIDVLGPI